MRIPLVITLACMLAATGFGADAVANFQTAMAGDDFQAKRGAIQALAGLSKDQDEKVLGLLVSAVSDRQASEAALDALRSRSGLAKPGGWVKRGGGFPNYPVTDDAAGWSSWLSAWKKANDEKKKVAEIDKKTKELEKKAEDKTDKAKTDKTKDGKEGEEGKGEETAGKEGEEKEGDKSDKNRTRTAEVDVERGPICRVHFRNGGSKVYRLVAKRTDADGNLLSIRVSHSGDGGTEVLTADAIARLEEDVK